MRRPLMCILILFCFWGSYSVYADPPIYIAFLWHYHQPIYVPYVEAYETILYNGPQEGPPFSFSLSEMWSGKGGAYRTWAVDAVENAMNAGLNRMGAQVNLTGSLIESLNNLSYHGWNGGFYLGWKDRWNQGCSWSTSGGTPRLDIVAFPYHHAIGGLIDPADLEMQIRLHRKIVQENFSSVSPFNGFFPAETCFHERMIPALCRLGIQWVLIDNIHFNRTLDDYPWNGGSGVLEPNGADKIHRTLNEMDPGSSWVNLSGVWAPEAVSPWAYRPHYVTWTDPVSGEKSRIIGVPAACYMGNEDARGGFGALNYEGVMSQLEMYNTDDAHPILIVLHHDGENFGAGVESYYHSNFQNFINWCLSNPTRFVPVTIQEYLNQFPPEEDDEVHVEPGGWIGSGCLDPEFHYWLSDPDPFPSGYSPDWNSWAVLTAAHNWVHTADAIQPWSDIAHILDDVGSETERAWHDYLCAQASDYEYWEGSADEVIWNANTARACNAAVQHAQAVVSGHPDTVGPSIFKPQRQPYNPGGEEWGIQQPSGFTVWTFVYDISGLESVSLKYRLDDDMSVDENNKIFTFGQWHEIGMVGEERPSQSAVTPLFKAEYFSAHIDTLHDILVDYYIEARDNAGNTARSEIQHVVIGTTSSGGTGVTWEPMYPTENQSILITVHNPERGGWLHWGVNAQDHTWEQPESFYWPSGTFLFQGTGPAVETPLNGPDISGNYSVTIGPFNNPGQPVSTIDFVIHFEDETWDNNDGNDYHINISTQPTSTPFPGTPTATPTPPGNTPTPAPTMTSTPVPTCVPSATATGPPPEPTTPTPAADLQFNLVLNRNWFHDGDRFILSCVTINPLDKTFHTDRYVILQVADAFYFYPSWSEYVDFQEQTIPGAAHLDEILISFDVPEGISPGGPFFFYGALTEHETYDLLTELSQVVFGFY